MKTLKRFSRVLIILVMTFTSAVLAGSYSNRWGEPADLAAAGSKVDGLPRQIGDWKAESVEQLEPEVVALLQCAGHTARVYQNTKTGARASMMLIVGPPGPTSVHTPDVCFTSSSYVMTKAPQAVKSPAAGDSGDSFWEATFRSVNVEGERLRVYYAWNDGQHWKAASSPRFDFAGVPVLYKLQVVANVDSTEDGATDADDASSFLAALLPALNKLVRDDVAPTSSD